MDPNPALSASPRAPARLKTGKWSAAASAETGLILFAAILMVAISAVYGLMPQT